MGDNARARDIVSPAPWAATSTHGLLLLLTRFSGPWSANGRINELEAGSELLLAALLAKLPSDFKMVIRLGGDPEWKPPYVVEGGGSSIELVVQGGFVDVGAARTSAGDEFAECFPGICEDVDHMPIMEFLQHDVAIDTQASTDQGWLPQLAWQLGSLLEPILLDVEMTKLSTTSWFHESLLVTEGVTKDGRGPLLAAYCEQNGKHIVAESVVGVGLDDARVGRKPIKLVAVTWPRLGSAAWLCPQARKEGKTNKEIVFRIEK